MKIKLATGDFALLMKLVSLLSTDEATARIVFKKLTYSELLLYNFSLMIHFQAVD